MCGHGSPYLHRYFILTSRVSVFGFQLLILHLWLLYTWVSSKGLNPLNHFLNQSLLFSSEYSILNINLSFEVEADAFSILMIMDELFCLFIKLEQRLSGPIAKQSLLVYFF